MVTVSARGISMIQGRPKVMETLSILREDEDADSEVAAARLKAAKKEAELAATESKEGFPLLYSWALISYWARLESLIKTVVATWLKHEKSIWQSEDVLKLKVKVSEYESLSRQDKCFYVADLLERDSDATLKRGINRFEVLLKPLGLSGSVPNKIKDTIYEMGQVRNLIVHRSAKVDRTFKKACPRYKIAIGKELKVTRQMISAYSNAMHLYVTLLIHRTVYGNSPEIEEHYARIVEDADTFLTEYLTKLKRK